MNVQTAVGAPAPRPSDEAMLEAIGALTLREFVRLRDALLRRLGGR